MSLQRDTVLGGMEEEQCLGWQMKEVRGGQVEAAEQTGWSVDSEAPLHKKSNNLASAVLSSGCLSSLCHCVWANGQVPTQLLLKLPLL